MDHLSKEDTEETITSWSKQCLFSHREIVVDKAKLYCSFVPWSGQDIKKQCFLTSLRRSGAWKTFPFFKKTTKTFKGKKKMPGLLRWWNQHRSRSIGNFLDCS